MNYYRLMEMVIAAAFVGTFATAGWLVLTLGSSGERAMIVFLIIGAVWVMIRFARIDMREYE